MPPPYRPSQHPLPRSRATPKRCHRHGRGHCRRTISSLEPSLALISSPSAPQAQTASNRPLHGTNLLLHHCCPKLTKAPLPPGICPRRALPPARLHPPRYSPKCSPDRGWPQPCADDPCQPKHHPRGFNFCTFDWRWFVSCHVDNP